MKSSGSTSMKQSTIFGLSQPAHESSLAADMTKPQQKGREQSMVWQYIYYNTNYERMADMDIDEEIDNGTATTTNTAPPLRGSF